MDNLLQEFLVESHENLDQLDQDLVRLEEEPANRAILSRIFRTIHTLKGSCGFLGFTTLESITHVGENLLSRLRDGELQFNAEITTALLALVDAVRQMLTSIEVTGQEGESDYAGLIVTLSRLQQGEAAGTETRPPPASEKPTAYPTRNGGGEVTAALSATAPPQDPLAEPTNSDMDHRIEAFLVDSYGHLDRLDQHLVRLAEGPAEPEMLSHLFLLMHNLKNACAFLGFARIESITHVGASLLGRLRDGELQPNVEITTTLFALVDAVRQMLASIEVTGYEGDLEYSHLLATLTRLQAVSAVTTRETPASGMEEPAVPSARDREAQVATTPQREAWAASVADTSIRVDVRLLDTLMDQVGELVLVRNRIMQFRTEQEERSILAAYQRLDLITMELQESVMKTRMQPIDTLWNKFPRVVRDLALECGKKINVSMDGQETELDRTLLEAIKAPLTHLVRNAVDHGIETPEARRKAGKPETGALFLRAFHEGGQVNIEIADDGGGIDPERIAHKAIERNLITAQQAAQMSQRDFLNLIFTPGFSTAEKVTNVSGRGVGMDVAKNNIEKINGSIDVQSQIGRGTTVKIKIPLTLAIIPALIVRCAGERYAIPQVSLIEVVRLAGEDAHQKTETFYRVPVYRLRGKLLPLVFLSRELRLTDATAPAQGDDDNYAVNIVVLQADDRQFGLVVDSVHDTEEIVVKPLGKQLKALSVFAGATIMGDGKVALILDVLGLAQRARVVSERRQALQEDPSAYPQGQRGDSQTLLLFANASGERLALPLSQVARLEKFSRSQVECAGPREVVQYRGQIMPLIQLSQVLANAGPGALLSSGNGAAAERETLEVVVHTNRGHSIGLVVDRILDIVEDTFAVQGPGGREGVCGTLVVQGKVTELLDLDKVIHIADPGLFKQLTTAEVKG